MVLPAARDELGRDLTAGASRVAARETGWCGKITAVGTGGVDLPRNGGHVSRPRSSFLLPILVLGVVLGAGATPAGAATAVTPAKVGQVIKGDITADSRTDQITLGSAGTVMPACSAKVLAGLAGGGYATGTFHPLPVHGMVVLACPDLGVVVAGPSPSKARLAVTWSSVPPMNGPSVQFFRWTVATQTWTYDGGTSGQYQPSTLASSDLDGDGYGDLVETTDQGDGVSVYVGKASTYRQLWTSSPSSEDTVSLTDLDHGPGLDIVDGHSFFGYLNVGVTVVDGRTGNHRALIDDTSGSGVTYVPQPVDVDHDGWTDVRVKRTAADGSSLPTLVFRNLGTGKLSFKQV